MTLALPADLNQFVAAEISAGKYASEQEVVCQGLRLLRDNERRQADLQRDLQVAEDQLARGESMPGEEVFRALRAQAQAMSQAAQ